jgi:hypothetical protein
MVPFVIKVQPALKTTLEKAARRRRTKPSTLALTYIKEGLDRERPGALLGAMKGIFQFSSDFDPSAPVFAPDDWSLQLLP